jgi:hypothetical protein
MALMVVLFAITYGEPKVTRGRCWQRRGVGRRAGRFGDGENGAMKILPFAGPGEEQYSTYLHVGCQSCLPGGSRFFWLDLPGTSVPGFVMPSLRDCDSVDLVITSPSWD